MKGLCGGSASGKTTVAKKIIEELNVQWVSLLSMDSFYKVINLNKTLRIAHKCSNQTKNRIIWETLNLLVKKKLA
jgi:uridine kinase